MGQDYATVAAAITVVSGAIESASRATGHSRGSPRTISGILFGHVERVSISFHVAQRTYSKSRAERIGGK